MIPIRAEKVRRTVLLPLLLAMLAAAATAEVRFFSLQSRSDFLNGTLDRISLDALGRLALADGADRLADIDEPFVLSAARHPEGWVVGTGNSGRVLLVGRDGEVRELFAAEEPEIFAVWADSGGTVFAGSSPGGKVYRIDSQEAGVFFDPEQTYIWALRGGDDGSLLVATGTEGKLFRVDKSGKGSLLFDSEDTHLRALENLPGGDVLVGTAGEGLILRVDAEGKARTLYDAAQPEIVSFAVDPDGNSYAAALASEASLIELRKPAPPGERSDEAAANGGAEGEAKVEVSVAEAGAPFAGSRPASFQGPRSSILRITPQGLVETLWRFHEQTAYSLGWYRGRLWIGTGLEGKIYSLRERKVVLEQDVDERQVVALLPDDPGPAFATTNAAALYRVSDRTEGEGVFTSQALDAGQIAEFGTLTWRGELPAGAGIEFSARSGISAEPDLTWSPWTPAAAGAEVALQQVPAGRYVQWRATLTSGKGISPALDRVEVSYRQLNLPPDVRRLVVLDPGEIVVPANFNPSNQVFEPAYPNRQGIFTTLKPAETREERRKTLWKRGFRTLRWEADDPNEDSLRYRLDFRSAAGGAWLPMAEDLTDNVYSFDATALPDGVYRFRLQAADRSAEDDEKALIAEEVSGPVLIDHAPPELVSARRQAGSFRVEVADAINPLRSAEVSIEAGEWAPIRPADGILDGRRETLEVNAPAEAEMVLLRLTDAAFNLVTFDLVEASR